MAGYGQKGFRAQQPKTFPTYGEVQQHWTASGQGGPMPTQQQYDARMAEGRARGRDPRRRYMGAGGGRAPGIQGPRGVPGQPGYTPGDQGPMRGMPPVLPQIPQPAPPPPQGPSPASTAYGGYGGVSARDFRRGDPQRNRPAAAYSQVGTGPGALVNAMNRNSYLMQGGARAAGLGGYGSTGAGRGGTYGGGAGSGAGGGGPLSGVMQQYQDAFDESKKANEDRYQQGVGGYQNRYDRGMGYLDQLGRQEAKDIGQDYDNLQSRVDQNMVSRGLTGTTIAPTMRMGVQREYGGAIGRLNERLANQRLNTDAQLSGDLLGFVERREDVGPDYNQMLALMQAVGAGGDGSGAGYGGTPRSQAGVPYYMSPQQMGYQLPGFMGGGQQQQQRQQQPQSQQRQRQPQQQPSNIMALLQQMMGQGQPQVQAGGLTASQQARSDRREREAKALAKRRTAQLGQWPYTGPPAILERMPAGGTPVGSY